MATSSDVAAGQTAQAAQYNNLRSDVLNAANSHRHSGSVDDGRTLFGTRDLSVILLNTNYQASVDMFVLVHVDCTSGSGCVEGRVDTSSPANTIHVAGAFQATTMDGGLCLPVKKGEWFRITAQGTYGGSISIRTLYIGA